MRKLISFRFAAYGILIILSAFLVFHFLVMFGIIPFDIVWGGRLKTREEMLVSETISILLNLIMIAAVAISAGLLRLKINPRIIKVVMWLMFVLFLFNTIGNLFSLNEFEKMAFTPVTLLLAVFSLRLAIGNERLNSNFETSRNKKDKVPSHSC